MPQGKLVVFEGIYGSGRLIVELVNQLRAALVKQGRMHVQAGAGIVADSVPENEWQETRAKASAVLRAAEIAMRGMEKQEAPA